MSQIANKMGIPMTATDAGNGDVKYSLHCPSCGELASATVPWTQFQEWTLGCKIQNAMPQLRPQEREMFLSGLCAACYERMSTK